MDISLDDFVSGMLTKLNKTAEEMTSVNSSIFPTIDSQHTWKFAKSGNKLHLHDGNIVHAFSTEAFKDDEDFPMQKEKDVSYFDFNKDMEHTGTAQVHKANPGMIYVTLHDGGSNPTYTITHVSEHSWRASPKAKNKTAEVFDFDGFSDGLKEKLGFDPFQALNTAGDYVSDGVRALGERPEISALGGLALGGAYDLGKRWLYNTPEENEQESFGTRALRYVAPAALAGGLGWAQRSLIPDHYEGGPLNRSVGGEALKSNVVPSPEDERLNAIKGMHEHGALKFPNAPQLPPHSGTPHSLQV